MNKRLHIEVRGCVQGVGFRPTVYRYAVEAGLAGFVLNALSGVVIEVEGAEKAAADFVQRLRAAPPPQARIDGFEVREIPVTGERGFRIARSRRSGDVKAGMPPDLATCEDCRREMFDPADRRYRYPFINCTNCGPRFTIIRSLPYDRARTSMADFPLCPECRAEYENPLDRRFDAQPNACPICGPRVVARTLPEGRELPGEAIDAAVARLRRGETVAVKGLGGFHLACLATDDAAVARLRRAKGRPHKAFAVMFASLEEVRRHCLVSAEEAALLESPARPIVILRRRRGSGLSPRVSPDSGDVGAFLPYTPLHWLLLEAVSPLIMTSANRSEEPIASDFAELRAAVSGQTAPTALDHNRAIVRRCDDSVLRWAAGGPLPIRRSRGYVPAPVRLPLDGPPVLACGAELKAVFCITRGADAFLSQHIGDLADWNAYRFYEHAVADLTGLLEVSPEAVACDLHPDYLSTRFARAAGIAPVIAVQHHHAHAAACLAENGQTGPALAVALDGTGYGPDGTIWGGEFLLAELRGFQRLARFSPVPLPGGDAAVRHPDRMALSWLAAVFGEKTALEAASSLLPSLDSKQIELLLRVRGIPSRSPLTSSAGRLFDAVSALLGLCSAITYEGQAAVRLQSAAERFGRRPDPWPVALVPGGDGLLEVSFASVLRAIAGGPARGARKAPDCEEAAARFHASVAGAVLAVCERFREMHGVNTVALTGGVFQNALLLEWTVEDLTRAGFTVLRHRQVPPNDAGIAYGQAAVALARLGEKT